MIRVAAKIILFFKGLQPVAVGAKRSQILKIVVFPVSILMVNIKLAFIDRYKTTCLAGIFKIYPVCPDKSVFVAHRASGLVFSMPV